MIYNGKGKMCTLILEYPDKTKIFISWIFTKAAFIKMERKFQL